MKKILMLMMALILVLQTSYIKIYAKESTSKEEQVKDAIYDVVYLFKEILENQYTQTEEEVKELIVEKGYDYALSMDSFYNQPSPFASADYISYLAAYMSCKNYAKEHSLALEKLSEIPFLEYNVKETNITEYIPMEVAVYSPYEWIQDEYIKSGTSYLLEPEKREVYAEIQNGRYKKTDEVMEYVPETKLVTYIQIELSVLSPELLFDYLGIEKALVEADYESRRAVMVRAMTNQAIASTIMVQLPDIQELELLDLSEYSSYLENLDVARKTVVLTALSLKGKVPYEWGGKPAMPGYDKKWWSYNEKNGLQHGLDCSGFVQWSFMTAGFDKELYQEINTTKSILSSGMKQIKREELKPGDIGCTNRVDGGVNHTGIYLGDDLWIHCSSSKKTVRVSKVDFNVFFDPYEEVTGINEQVASTYLLSLGYDINGNLLSEHDIATITNRYNITKDIDTYNSIYYTFKHNEQEEILLAKLIYSEARGEGINGWIAVGEVVANRVMSKNFPDTISEVIYQSDQFSNSVDLDKITPSAEMIAVAQMVLQGKLKILEEPKVLYFRNPMKTDQIPATTKHDWGSHKWYKAIEHHAFYLE